MKLVTIFILASSVLLSLVMVTATSVLSDLAEPTPDLQIDDLESGRLLPMFVGPTLWTAFPSAPMHAEAVVDVPSMLFMGAWLLLIVVPSLRWLRVSWTVAAAMNLGAGLVAYAIGTFVLAFTSASPADVGGWVAFIIMSMLYAAAGSALLASFDVWRPRPKGGKPEIGTRLTGTINFEST